MVDPRTIYFSTDERDDIEKCTGKECRTREALKSTIMETVHNNQHKDNIQSRHDNTSKKVKGRINYSQSKNFKDTIDYVKLAPGVKAPEVTLQLQPQPVQIPPVKKDIWSEHSSLGRGPNFIDCKQCGTMKNPKGLTKSFKACPECQSNTLSKDAGLCPICGVEKPEDGWDDGIEIEDYLLNYN